MSTIMRLPQKTLHMKHRLKYITTLFNSLCNSNTIIFSIDATSFFANNFQMHASNAGEGGTFIQPYQDFNMR